MEKQCNKIIYQHNNQEYYCSLELTMDIIGGKWKSMMLFHLKDGTMRSGELQKTLQGIANRMFTLTARELEQDGMIERIVYPVVPPKVEYKLTKKGESILPIILQMAQWGEFIGTPNEHHK